MKHLIWKIWFPCACCLLISFLLWCSYISFSFENFIEENQQNKIQDIVAVVEVGISHIYDGAQEGKLQNFCQKIKQHLNNGRLTIIDAYGKVLGDSDVINYQALPNHADRPEFKGMSLDKPCFIHRFSETLQADMIYYSKPIFQDGKLLFVIRFSTSFTNFDQAIVYWRSTLLITACLVLFLTGAVSYWLMQRATRSVEHIRELAGRFAIGDFSQQITEVPDIIELRNLVDSMNMMVLELKTRIKTVRHQKNQLEAILSGMQEGVIALNDKNEIITMNQASADLFKIEIERGVGQKLIYLLRFPELHEFCQLVWQKKESMNMEKVWTHGEKEILLHVQCSPMYKRSGEVTGLVLVFNDVTRIRHLEQMRKDFVANVSHELRTPLTAIQGFVETLLDGAVDDHDNCLRFLKIIDKQTHRLNNLIADLLELSHLETMEKEGLRGAHQCLIRPILNDIKTIVNEKMIKNNQVLKITCDEKLEGFVNDSLLEQALLNLIDNAVNYSPENTVVQVTVLSENQHLIFKIRDQGPGIPEELQNRVFERFYRVDKGRGREQGGTGIGLAIVRHVVELHHGTIELHNIEGGGCCFTIDIPFFKA